MRKTDVLGRLIRAGVLVAVVAVTSCLATSFGLFVRDATCRSRQEEARAAISAVLQAQRAFRGENDRYADDVDELGIGFRLRRYRVEVRGHETGYEAWIRGRDKTWVRGDLWHLSENRGEDRTKRHLVDSCRRSHQK